LFYEGDDDRQTEVAHDAGAVRRAAADPTGLPGRTKKRYKGLDQAPHYVSPTLTYNFHRDYSLKQGQHGSILTLGGRVIVPYMGYHQHVALIEQGARIGAAKLWYDKPRKRFYVLIALEVEVADPTPETHQRVIGMGVCWQGAWRSKWTRTTRARRAPGVGTPARRTAPRKDSCSRARTATIPCMPISSARATLRCERCSSGKTG
jgi:hypothetical protein